MLEEVIKVKRERIDIRIERLNLLKKLSTKIAEEILLDEINLSADEVEIILSFLEIDLKTLSKPAPAEEFLRQQVARIRAMERLAEF